MKQVWPVRAAINTFAWSDIMPFKELCFEHVQSYQLTLELNHEKPECDNIKLILKNRRTCSMLWPQWRLTFVSAPIPH